MKAGKPSNYFKSEHENELLFVTWADVIDRGGNQFSVLYKLAGSKKQYRCARGKSAWLDTFDLEYARKVISDWKNSNNNQLGKGSLLPPMYLGHREDFIKWLGNTARHATISSYESFLRMYVFPFFVEKLLLENPTKWDDDALARWSGFLDKNVESLSTRNRIRTGLRRYLKFLKYKNIIKRIPDIYNESRRRNSKETPIPGDLPEWSDVVDWIRSLPKGRYRFIRGVMKAFGLRISEACLVNEFDFFGSESEDEIDQKNDYIRELKNNGIGKLFLHVNKADKRKVGKHLIDILGEQETEPKSGPYTACCTNKEFATLIVEMIQNKEHLEELSRDEVYRVKSQMPVDYSSYNFHKYKLHDDRRLNITLQLFDLKVANSIDMCCMLHGQSSRDVFSRYFQWGLVQKRKKKQKKGFDLKIFN
jgi:integrase